MSLKLPTVLVFVNFLLVISIVVLFFKNSQLKEEIVDLTSSIDSRISLITDQAKSQEEISKDITTTMANYRKHSEENKQAIDSWKEDLRSKVTLEATLEITKEIIQKGAEDAVNNLSENSDVFKQEFIDAVAKALTQNHLLMFKGAPGIDANNKSIAKFLLSDPEFLNQVSISVLLKDSPE